ncbi:pyridine nucleotide-disulfide oxidoreductase [Rhodococcus rhodnii]|uniref:Ferredoxin--NAD(+) reductase n=2 Tax=Rhodococcus rhodnii TaxID=38312 RepID=R7WI28_9NOCA|nr:FAD-dependent oxidoreductase [Rhodococcus rhodnii]EOM74818.1 ferredoxin--NAD(+) reductase [Rhodococcus rhodnii LMG 5362]TXG90967.1 pyridine nucleotide-disulfide oxidoreductase [Rhodococcus rhodnii]
MASRAGTVVVGGGQAGCEVAFALRSAGYGDPITIVCGEAHLPYERPPLSKGVLGGATDPAKLTLRSERAYEAKSVSVRIGDPVVAIDREGSVVRTAAGEEIAYDALVLATGADAIRPEWAGSSRIHTIRTLDDSLAVAPRRGDRVAVIGGSFLGLEAASSLSGLVSSVTVVESTADVLPGRVSRYTAQRIRKIHEDSGIRFVLGERVTAVTGGRGAVESGGGIEIALRGGRTLDVDWAVLAIGACPRDELAAASGIETARGIVVDECCRTSDPDIYAIGDVAITRTASGVSAGVESVASAMAQARIAAAAIAGTPPPALRPETFWSEQYGTQLRIAGLVGATDSVVDSVEETEDGGFVVRRSCRGALVSVEAFGSPRQFALGLRELATTVKAGESDESDLSLQVG